MGRDKCSAGTSQLARRAATASVVALLLVLAPTAAQALFSATDSRPFSVGTLRLAAPASLKGSSSCPRQGNVYGGSYAGTSFAPVEGATTYLVTLDPPEGASVTKTLAAGTSSFVLGAPSGGRGLYRLTIRAQAAGGQWWGPDLAVEFRC